MTRKDYVLIAAAINRAYEQWGGITMPERNDIKDALSDLASDIAGELAAANPNFQAVTFLKACGVADD